MAHTRTTTYIQHNKKGFTLVEMLVSVAIFLVVMVISVGMFLTMTDAERKSRDLRLAMDNFSVVLEDMIRSIRTGYDYICGGLAFSVPRDCPGGDASFAFTQSNGSQAEYKLQSGIFYKTWTPPGGMAPLTWAYFQNDPKLTVNNLTFVVRGADATEPDTQPYVLISLEGEVVTRNIKTPFHAQTFIDQRGLKLPP